MSLTRRGRVFVTIGLVLALACVVGAALVMAGSHDPITAAFRRLTGQSPSSPPKPCPLTGLAPQGGREVPRRPLLAIKVENTSAAYPLAGLDKADIIYEELVEGGITRFMAIYQCQDSARVGPVRSARTTDPRVLRPYEKHPLIAYSGGQSAVVNLLNAVGLIGLTETSAPAAFHRDPARAAPHNLFVNTLSAYKAGKKATHNEGAPSSLFSYSSAVPRGKHIRSATIQFSYSATAVWSWSAGHWVRMLGSAPMKLESGTPISADNVVIQQVVVSQGSLVDVLGNHSPEVTLVGTGKAWLLRDGKMISGTWVRNSITGRTAFKTLKGVRLQLKPGTTWVELMPKGERVSFAK